MKVDTKCHRAIWGIWKMNRGEATVTVFEGHNTWQSRQKKGMNLELETDYFGLAKEPAQTHEFI